MLSNFLTDYEVSLNTVKSLGFYPLFDRVVVTVIPEPERTLGGIIIPEVVDNPSLTGEVVALGRGTKTKKDVIIPPGFGVGDRILFSKRAGFEIIIDGNKYMLMRMKDVLAVYD